MKSYEVFRSLMYKKNVKFADVIRDTGVSRPVLTDWKMGRKEPSLKTLRRLADYFGISVTKFID